MTVPLRTGEEIAVNVALGTRSYDIVIGPSLVGLGEFARVLRVRDVTGVVHLRRQLQRLSSPLA